MKTASKPSTVVLENAETTDRRRGLNGDSNKLHPQDRAAHGWYRFVLSFPPQLVRTYLQRFGMGAKHRVLDPFCGTGTTLVECKKLGISSVGVEANPMAYFASQVKVDWSPDPDGLIKHATKIAQTALAELESDGIDDEPLPLFRRNGQNGQAKLRTLSPERMSLLLTDSISPLPLHKTLVLLDCLKKHSDDRYRGHELLALAKALVFSISNLHFGPEVGTGSIKPDASVIGTWLTEVRAIAHDLRVLSRPEVTPSVAHHFDSRQMLHVLDSNSIDAVITSPPYPNEKDYTRTTRLESVLLGFICDKAELQALKRQLVRSNTRGVYKGDDDDQWVASFPRILKIARAVEARRIAMGKTSGFERMYSRVILQYFGGMARHLAELRSVLRPGAQLAYVVGDQASYLRVMIRTGQLLAEIAESLGYRVIDIDLFRSRLSTTTREYLREEVVILQWSGQAKTDCTKIRAKVRAQ